MSDDDLTGRVLGHYRIGRRLGGGGMGDVWAAVQEPLGRPVAVKVLRREFAADAELAVRFKREAELAASLAHPNIAQVTDFGVEDGRAYLVMDLLQGESLAALLTRVGALGETRARRICAQVLDALAVAHDRGVVHRDIKPDNVFVQQVGATDVVKLLDFGIARIDERHATVTNVGAVLGTPAYMSPEQARGHKVDARSDVFSVGVMMYELLSGSCPFGGTNLHEVLFAVVEARPTPLDQLDSAVPPSLARVIERAMEKTPEARFASAREMHDALIEAEVSPADIERAVAREALESAPTLAAFPATTPATYPPPRSDSAPRVSPTRAGALAAVVVVLVAGAIYLFATRGTEPVAATSAPRVVLTAVADPTPAPPTSTIGAPPEVADPGTPAREPVVEIASSPDEPSAIPEVVHARVTPAVLTVECGGYPRELPVVRATDRLTFSSADGLSTMSPGLVSSVRDTFNLRAATGLARCYRGHGIRRGQEFDLDVDGGGHVTRVEVGAFCPVDPGVVSCARRVLSAVEVSTESPFRVRLGADLTGR